MRTHLQAISILLVHFLIFFVLNQWLNPHPDMIDHWVWSRYLSLSYYEHPPMIAFAIRLITLIAGNSEIALETGAQFYNLLILFLIYRMTYPFFGGQNAIITLILLCSTAYFSLGTVFIHITQPFLICWVLGLWLILKYYQSPSAKWLLLLGIVAGFGALSKYIMLLLYLGLFFHSLIYREARVLLKNPWLYVAGSISLLIFTPVLVWNFQNDWISFRFQFGRGMQGADFGANFVFFTVGHLLLFSPIWSVLSFSGLKIGRENFVIGTKPSAVLLVLSLYPLFFFSIMSFRGTIADPHWMNLTYIGLMILLGSVLCTKVKDFTRNLLLAVGLFVNAIIIALAVAHTFYPLYDWQPFEVRSYAYLQEKGVPETTLTTLQNQQKRLYSFPAFDAYLRQILTQEEIATYGEIIQIAGLDTFSNRFNNFIEWPQTVVQLRKLLAKKGLTDPEYIVSREYQLSSALTFYFPVHPWSHSLEKPERNQWSPKTRVQKSKSIFVCDLNNCDQALAHYQREMQPSLHFLGEVLTRSHGRLVRSLLVYQMIPIIN